MTIDLKKLLFLLKMMKRISTVLPNKFFMMKLLKKYKAWTMNAVKKPKHL